MASPSFTPSPGFATTRWSMVLAAGDWRVGTAARRAMGELAQCYWFPLYAYLRRNGKSASEAEDLVQGFFTRLLDKDALASVDPSKGKFRSFLLASLKHFLANEWDKAHAQKRHAGGGNLTLDALDAETRYGVEPMDDMSPERVFEKRWAWTLLDQVLRRLREVYESSGQKKTFEILKGTLTSGGKVETYRQAAQELGTTEGAVAVAAHRLRQRYRQLLREEIAQTVSSQELIDEEIQYLLRCL